jgi:hypothetical protein
MVPVISLWLPIVVSAVLVFVASSILHMLLSYHNNDFGKLKAEDEVMDALRPFDITPGDYIMPCLSGPKEMGTEAFIAKTKKGPVAFLTVLPSSPLNMGAQLTQWFLYSIAMGAVAGYVAGLTLGPGADYRTVFRITSTVAFAGYSLALMQGAIWYKHNWGFTLKTMLDGLVYALLTAGTFGWLWPD